MQTGTVQEIGLSKSGKPKVKVDNQWYSIKGTLGMVPGQRIEFEAHEFQFNGKQFWGIDKYGMLPTNSQEGVHATPAASGRFVSPPQFKDVPPQTVAPAGYTEPELRFISNCVGSAIAAKTISDPIDLIAWTKGALAALKSLTEPHDRNQDPF